jgi:hypothetical protein
MTKILFLNVGQVGNLPPIVNRPVEHSDKVQQADLHRPAG